MKIGLWVSAAMVTCALNMTACAGINDGLVLHYGFDTYDGSTVPDGSGLGNHGVANGVTYSAAGAWGGCYRFDGTGDWILARNSASLSVTGRHFSIACWLKLPDANAMDNTTGIIVDKAYGIGGWTGYMIQYDDRNVDGLYRGIRASAGMTDTLYAVSFAPETITDTNWHHVASVYADSNIVIYVDGEPIGGLVNVKYNAQGMSSNVYDVHIGRNHTNNVPHFLNAWLDELRIYGRSLTEQEVRTLAAQRESTLPCPVLLTSIGFSNDPRGDEDVTVFYPGEDLHVRVCDVDLPEGAGPVRTKIWQWVTTPTPKWKIRQTNMTRDPDDGCYRGVIDLAGFQPGWINVETLATGGKVGLLRKSQIQIKAAP